MSISGLDGLSSEEIADELDRGAKFVIYQYCISILVMTFHRSSEIQFIRSDESRLIRGLRYNVLSMIAGWWGIPWGPIYTIASLATNLAGGKDVTQEVINLVNSGAEATDANPA